MINLFDSFSSPANATTVLNAPMLSSATAPADAYASISAVAAAVDF